MLLVKQELLGLGEEFYTDCDWTIIGAFKWWILHSCKDCTKFCPLCKWYVACQNEIKHNDSNYTF